MQGSTCNFLEGLCVITEGFWIQEKERCSVNTQNRGKSPPPIWCHSIYGGIGGARFSLLGGGDYHR